MPRGRFITVEGGEGAGKSTQVPLLVAALERLGIAAMATREPGGSPGAEAIRRLLLEGEGERWDAQGEALLLVAARRDHVNKLIEPALAQGIWVVCDRFADSTLAYQGYGRGLMPADLAALHRFALGDFAPDLTAILDLPVETGLARAAARSTAARSTAARSSSTPAAAADRFERLDRGFHDRLRQGFRQIAAAEPTRCVLVDAAGEPQSVHRAVLDAVVQRLGAAMSPAGSSR
jgi:dTMP kinase